MVETIETPLTKLLGIKYPIILAGMNKAAGPTLAAAVSNAGGLGVIGGVGYTPRILKLTINDLKSKLNDPNLPFGVDLLIPKIGKGARKTNYDYTKGNLDKLIDIIIESKCKLFVCAIGVPPKHIVSKLHENNILVMNMIGAPKHVKYALDAGVDIICAQGGEGGGHTGSIATSILLPTVVDLCKNKLSQNGKQPIYVVGAGGIYDGRGLAMALSYGCDAVWVGTRFVCSVEAGASLEHKQAIINAGYNDTYRTLVYTGRPLRCIRNYYIDHWEECRQKEMKELLEKGIVPYNVDMKITQELIKKDQNYGDLSDNDDNKNNEENEKRRIFAGFLSGQVCGAIKDIKPAKDIIHEMMKDAIEVFKKINNRITITSKL